MEFSTDWNKNCYNQTGKLRIKTKIINKLSLSQEVNGNAKQIKSIEFAEGTLLFKKAASRGTFPTNQFTQESLSKDIHLRELVDF